MKSFLELPAELRNHIYAEVVMLDPSSSDPRPASQKLQFLLTCRQVYQEASAIAFESTTFKANLFCHPFGPRVARLKDTQLDAIRSIDFTTHGRNEIVNRWDRIVYNLHLRSIDFKALGLNLERIYIFHTVRFTRWQVEKGRFISLLATWINDMPRLKTIVFLTMMDRERTQAKISSAFSQYVAGWSTRPPTNGGSLHEAILDRNSQDRGLQRSVRLQFMEHVVTGRNL